ncbi:isoamylase early set domain-containing protein [Bailinhaonella thermotolerans]|uniref:isoamylase early set domain-containing protein n=1 Tax=Bailinhaonella thermotolerans TaxID=1070861 RepID=UPI00192A5A9B|nr:isoamylase early set domain-containing protein [Bailinhaonella thermotolerans]
MIDRSGPDKNGMVRLTFILPAHQSGSPVSVVGDFNDWDPYAHPMKLGADGTRRVTLKVPARDRVRFRYLGHGGRWFDDPDADEHDGRDGLLRMLPPEDEAARDLPEGTPEERVAGRRTATRRQRVRGGRVAAAIHHATAPPLEAEPDELDPLAEPLTEPLVRPEPAREPSRTEPDPRVNTAQAGPKAKAPARKARSRRPAKV